MRTVGTKLVGLAVTSLLVSGSAFAGSESDKELAEMRLDSGGSYKPYKFRRVIGGDQPDNAGFLLPKALTWKKAGAEMEGKPFWEEVLSRDH